MTTLKITKDEAASPRLDRRAVLMRLGLAAGAIYAAPVLLQLSEARASGGSGGSGGGWGSHSGGRRRRRRHVRRRRGYGGSNS